MDAAGKDGAIKHVMSGVNPQGCQVFSFKAPPPRSWITTYLWRSMQALPERGRIGIFNRSYYEEVLVVARAQGDARRAAAAGAKLVEQATSGSERFEDINAFRAVPRDNGTRHPQVLPQRLERGAKATVPGAHRRAGQELEVLGRRRQRARVLGRLHGGLRGHDPETSTTDAPWYVVPADNKWFTRLAVADIIWQTIADLNLRYPKVTAEKKKELQEVRRLLLSEKD